MTNKSPEYDSIPTTRIIELEDKPGGWELQIETPKGSKLVTTREKFDKDFQGLSTEEIGDKLDREFEESEVQRLKAFGEERGDLVDYDEHDEEEYTFEPTEDPLAGDIEPTGGYPSSEIHPHDAHRLEVMRHHGDYTG